MASYSSSPALLGCLILPLLSAWGLDGDLNTSVYNVTVGNGDPVRMRSCWEENATFEHIRVNWIRNEHKSSDKATLIYNNLTKYGEYYSDKYTVTTTGNCSCLTVFTASVNDAGVYTCTVTTEIPFPKIIAKAEIHVTITANQTCADGKRSPPLSDFITPLAVVSVALCIAIFVYLWRRKTLVASQLAQSGRPGRIIREQPNEQGQQMEPEVLNEADQAGDGNSNSSRRSTQWCPVSVYESIDYFDVQTHAKAEAGEM